MADDVYCPQYEHPEPDQPLIIDMSTEFRRAGAEERERMTSTGVYG